ncbi:hypothetical protein KB206_09860 [Microvirga sp. STS02]|uniref:hypothetical protein n=1 Tax=Hymenobacter negativus TaxID=2795026 RepID=UPI0018DC6DF4|nr:MULTISPECIES: hypothetical protein [Bacteria]MBH8569188.1 hypothetical protein [Hymenobacter negativus]MBR7208923.1 hypothetical protein [Microvirga sp. STS02]
MQDFTLWIEFEHVDYSSKWEPESESFVTGIDWDRENEACNVIVDLPDGRHYGINVWTYTFLATVVALDVENNEHLNGLYQIPPDLFVKALTRECIEATIADLLQQGNLEDVLNPTVLGKLSSN